MSFCTCNYSFTNSWINNRRIFSLTFKTNIISSCIIIYTSIDTWMLSSAFSSSRCSIILIITLRACHCWNLLINCTICNSSFSTFGRCFQVIKIITTSTNNIWLSISTGYWLMGCTIWYSLITLFTIWR